MYEDPLFALVRDTEPGIRALPATEWAQAIDALPDPVLRWVLRERLHLMNTDCCSFCWSSPDKRHPDDRHGCQEPKGHKGAHACACGVIEARRTRPAA